MCVCNNSPPSYPSRFYRRKLVCNLYAQHHDIIYTVSPSTTTGSGAVACDSGGWQKGLPAVSPPPPPAVNDLGGFVLPALDDGPCSRNRRRTRHYILLYIMRVYIRAVCNIILGRLPCWTAGTAILFADLYRITNWFFVFVLFNE